MTRRCVADEQYGQLQRRLDEVARRVDEGTISFQDTMNALQTIAEGLSSQLPTTMTIAGRTYEILGFLREGEDYVKGDIMVSRAKEMQAHLGEDDGQHLLDHQSEIPVALRGMVFVFTDWRRPGGPGSVGCVDWGGGRWGLRWIWLDDDWLGGDRVLRCK